MEQNSETHLFDLQVDHQASAYLGETARWARFLAIVGFIFCAFFVLIAIFAGSLFAGAFGRLGGIGGMGAIGGVMLSFFYFALAVLCFFPCLYLYHFASKMQIALRNNVQEELNQSFRSLKSCYRFLGILMIILLGFYGLGIVGWIFAASFAR